MFYGINPALYGYGQQANAAPFGNVPAPQRAGGIPVGTSATTVGPSQQRQSSNPLGTALQLGQLGMKGNNLLGGAKTPVASAMEGGSSYGAGNASGIPSGYTTANGSYLMVSPNASPEALSNLPAAAQSPNAIMVQSPALGGSTYLPPSAGGLDAAYAANPGAYSVPSVTSEPLALSTGGEGLMGAAASEGAGAASTGATAAEGAALASEGAAAGSAAAEGGAAAAEGISAASASAAPSFGPMAWIPAIIAAAAAADNATGGHIIEAPIQTINDPIGSQEDPNFWGNLSGWNSFFGSGGLFG